MAQVLVRNLSEETKRRLQRRAKANGRSLEAEVRGILDEVAKFDAVRVKPLGSDWVAEFIEQSRASGITKEDGEELDRLIKEGRRNRDTFQFDEDQ